jgi:hypothetical protein
MCLHVITSATEAMKQKTGEIKAYKVYKVQKIENTNIYKLFSPIKLHKVKKAGSVVSNRKTNKLAENEITVEKGIHVFLSKESAEDFVCCDDEYIVEVECDIKNLVAVGHDLFACQGYASAAVFTKINISKKEFDKTIKIHKDNIIMRKIDEIN